MKKFSPKNTKTFSTNKTNKKTNNDGSKLNNIINEYVTNYMELNDINLEKKYAESLSGDSALKSNENQFAKCIINKNTELLTESFEENSASNTIQNKKL